MNIKCLILVLVILTGCRSQPELAIDTEIILVNAGQADRNEIASAINRLARCQPKVVGINFVFEDKKETSSDLHLAESIKEAGNIVLVSRLKDEKIISSDSLFTSYALAQGPLYYGLDNDDSIDRQMMYMSVGDDLIWSFPTTLASYFDVDVIDRIMDSGRGNTFYEIDYRNDFKVIDINSDYDCALISGKMVIMGYLGPGDEDLYSTSTGHKKYSTWILANCVRNIRDSALQK